MADCEKLNAHCVVLLPHDELWSLHHAESEIWVEAINVDCAMPSCTRRSMGRTAELHLRTETKTTRRDEKKGEEERQGHKEGEE